MSIEIKVKKIHPDAIIPKYAHDGDAGMDLYSIENYEINFRERVLVKTGLQIEILRGYEMQIRPKSGLALKSGISVLNNLGTVDSGYRGEIGVILINHGSEIYSVKKGEKVAQGVINKIEKAVIIEVENLSDTKRGAGGFGSTGI
jgi:dUTP pyrophosphatase